MLNMMQILCISYSENIEYIVGRLFVGGMVNKFNFCEGGGKYVDDVPRQEIQIRFKQGAPGCATDVSAGKLS